MLIGVVGSSTIVTRSESLAVWDTGLLDAEQILLDNTLANTLVAAPIPHIDRKSTADNLGRVENAVWVVRS